MLLGTHARRRIASGTALLVVLAVSTLVVPAVHAEPDGTAAQDATSASPKASPEPSPDAHATMHSLDVPVVAPAPSPAGRMMMRADAPEASGTTTAAPSTTGTTATPQVVAELPTTATKPFGLVGVTWRAGYPSGTLTVQVRTHDSDGWTGWDDLELDPDAPPTTEPGSRDGTSPTWVGDADGVGVRLLSTTDSAPEDVQVAVIDGGTGLAQPAADPATDTTTDPASTTATEPARATARTALARTAVATTPTTATTGTDTTATAATAVATTATSTATAAIEAGVAPRPTIITRAQWGVDRSTEISCSAPITSTFSGIVLHHTVGANSYTEAQAPGIVRGIHLFHTKSRGWCDIGYNFLVDKYGNIYEGRRGGIDKQVRGAHAGNWDVNSHTTGISMMGNFDTVPLTTALKSAVVKLAAWRLSSFGFDATGSSTFDGKKLPRISGHRDVYAAGIRPATATACPGGYGEVWMKDHMRADVQAAIDAAAALEPKPVRLAGADRYATAAAVSRDSFPTAGGPVFLASGEAFADALSAGPAAAHLHAPLLLVRKDRLPPETVTELQRLAPSTVYVLGGEDVVSPNVKDQLKAYAGSVTRLGGRNRYETSAVVAEAFWPSSAAAYVASGVDYPDALSAGALAALDQAPILLSRTDRLPPSTATELSRLHPGRVTIIGGLAALTTTVEGAVGQAAPDTQRTRLGGTDRYATSAAIAAAGWTTAQRVFFALGTNFPDALAGVPSAAAEGAPLLLARHDCLPSVVFDEMTALTPQTHVVLGGTDSLTDRSTNVGCG